MILRVAQVIMVALASTLVAASDPPRTMSELLAHSTTADWRRLDPANTLYLQLDTGRVIIELAPEFAPRHVANIRALTHEHFYDGLAVERVQDNFVVQWGDPTQKRPVGTAARTLPAEFTQPVGPSLPFTKLSDADGYAPSVGFTLGLPAARDASGTTTWLVHCYGALGVGRDNDADSGGGTELYVVIGHAPRQLDRNATVVGRVVSGMELLATLPRGTGPLGFYERPQQGAVIRSVRLAADLPAPERTTIEVLRTDTPLFARLVAARRNRTDDWYKVPAGYIDLCNVPLPVRISAPSPSG